MICRGRVTISQSLEFDTINEYTSASKLQDMEQLRLRDMTLLEFHSRLKGGWDTLYFAKEFYLFSGRLPRWFQQGNFHKLRPLSCLKDAHCPGCGETPNYGSRLLLAALATGSSLQHSKVLKLHKVTMVFRAHCEKGRGLRQG